MLRSAFFSLSLSVVLSLVAACGKTDPARQGVDPRDEVSAAVQIGESFTLQKDKTGKNLIGIKKTALEKEFLLQVEMMKQNTAPLGSALKSRVVALRLRDGKLWLVEATQGHTVTNEFPQTLLLAQFPIVEQTNDTIVFDFNTGMGHLFDAGEWRGSDNTSGAYRVEGKANVLHLSYLDNVGLTAKNALSISQVAQLESDVDGKREFLSVEVRYYLSPYHPNKAFTPTLSPGFDRVGFFEVAPQLMTTGKTVIRATKFDTAKPIVFAVSSNTPADYRQAVKEGVLYWNRFLKGAPIQVIDAPEAVRAPNIDFNVVQWVSWNTAGYAYADDQADPRSGEILHAQVYIPSVFAYPRKEMAKSLIEKMKMPALSGFGHEETCQFDVTQFAPGGEASLIVSQADKSKMLKASQDAIRYVVAHEIGHTLGLRHNFAGNLGATAAFSLKGRKDILAAYLKDGKTPAGVVPTASVMDYLPFEEAVLTGSAMTDAAVKPDYDFKAMTTLYENKRYAAKDIPTYCSDTMMNKFIDCQPFDSGHSAVEYAGWAASQSVVDFPYTLLSKFEAAKRGADGNAVTALETLAFDPNKIATSFFSGPQDLIDGFGKDTRFVKIHRLFPLVGPLNKDDVSGAELEHVDNEVKRLGGAEFLFPAVTAADLARMKTQFTATLANRHDDNGDAVNFDADETKVVDETAKEIFEALPVAVAKADIKMLSKLPAPWMVPGTAIGEGIKTVIAKRVEEYTFAVKAGETIDATLELPNLDKKKEGDPATVKIDVKLPVFVYPFAARSVAYALFSATGPMNAGWANNKKVETQTKMVNLVKAAVKNYPLEKLRVLNITPVGQNMAVSKWMFEASSIVNGISK